MKSLQGLIYSSFPDALELPKRWKKGRLVFVNSTSDLFHDDVPLDYIQKVLEVMRECQQHTLQVLTKRAARLAQLAGELTWAPNVWTCRCRRRQRAWRSRASLRTVGDVSDARIAQAIERYLRSGGHEHDHPEWPGNLWDRAKKGHDDLLDALVKGVRRRADGRTHAPVPADLDLISWTRRKLKPMVDGLFRQAEREAVLALLERSVVFLTGDNVETVLRDQSWLHSAWDLANLYLSSVDAELLGPEAPSLLGLSEETTCYVSADYFADQGRFNDFVIHEAAHVFHNWKRRNTGLRETRTREWLLEIEFKKRETFAYSCEAYGWIIEHARARGERIAMGQEYAAGVHRFTDEVLDAEELASIVSEACESRNGWKAILRRCAPPKMTRRDALALLAQGAR
jgi:phage protein Gp37/Gp68